MSKYRVTIQCMFEVDGDTIWPEPHFKRSVELAKDQFMTDPDFLMQFISRHDVHVEDISAIGSYDYED